MSCPCCSGQPYESCCKPLHQGVRAPNALALMRSRYSAYAMHNVDYILRTQTREKKRAEVVRFCTTTTFKKLEVLEFIDGENEAYVTFKAHLEQKGEDCSFIEKSRFEKVNDIWIFVLGLCA